MFHRHKWTFAIPTVVNEYGPPPTYTIITRVCTKCASVNQQIVDGAVDYNDLVS